MPLLGSEMKLISRSLWCLVNNDVAALPSLKAQTLFVLLSLAEPLSTRGGKSQVLFQDGNSTELITNNNVRLSFFSLLFFGYLLFFLEYAELIKGQFAFEPNERDFFKHKKINFQWLVVWAATDEPDLIPRQKLQNSWKYLPKELWFACSNISIYFSRKLLYYKINMVARKRGYNKLQFIRVLVLLGLKLHFLKYLVNLALRLY